MSDPMRIEDAPKNHWCRIERDGSLIRYYDMKGGLARCQRLDGKMISLSGSVVVRVEKPLAYTIDEEFDCT